MQVENKFKSLERSYKNMVTNNKKTGRNRISCPYETELTNLFANKHNIIPLAVSGSEGTIVRETAKPSQANKENHNLSTGTIANVEDINNNEDDNDNDMNTNLATIDTDNPSTSNARSNNINCSMQTLQTTRTRQQVGTTGKLLEICQQQIQSLIQDIRQERKDRLELQQQMQKTYTEYLKKIHETMQEKNEILKKLVAQSQNEID